jgi:hypothetical protein
VVKVSFSDDAAKTVIVPVAAGLLPAGEDGELPAAGAELGLLLVQPATAATASAAMVRA